MYYIKKWGWVHREPARTQSTRKLTKQLMEINEKRGSSVWKNKQLLKTLGSSHSKWTDDLILETVEALGSICTPNIEVSNDRRDNLAIINHSLFSICFSFFMEVCRSTTQNIHLVQLIARISGNTNIIYSSHFNH